MSYAVDSVHTFKINMNNIVFFCGFADLRLVANLTYPLSIHITACSVSLLRLAMPSLLQYDFYVAHHVFLESIGISAMDCGIPCVHMRA